MEKSETRENSESAVEYLMRMRDEGYLFHGSGNPVRMDLLEPRLARDPKNSWNSDKAIYASSEPVWSAVFAVYKGKHPWSTWVVTDDEGRIKRMEASIPASYWEELERSVGWVYVLPGESFERYETRSPQFKSKVAVAPVGAVEVRLSDYIDMGGKVVWTKERERPEFLYHASPFKDVKEFEPRAESVRDESEGPVVFGTPSEAYASMFLVRTDDSWSHMGKFGEVYYKVISDRNRFEAMDKGGSIYRLPVDGFTTDAGKGMGDEEWINDKPVKPVGKKDYQSGLDAMIQHGVQVYFVDSQTWMAIEASDDHRFKILKRCESENKKRGVNYIPLPEGEG